MKCLAEIVRCGDTITVKLDGEPYDYINLGEVTILRHREHEEGDFHCVEIECPGKPEEIVRVRAAELDWNTLRGQAKTHPPR
jgi:hypothetical protein